MLEDKAGNIWFGSADAGACRYDGKTFTNFSATEPASVTSQAGAGSPQTTNPQRLPKATPFQN